MICGMRVEAESPALTWVYSKLQNLFMPRQPKQTFDLKRLHAR